MELTQEICAETPDCFLFLLPILILLKGLCGNSLQFSWRKAVYQENCYPELDDSIFS